MSKTIGVKISNELYNKINGLSVSKSKFLLDAILDHLKSFESAQTEPVNAGLTIESNADKRYSLADIHNAVDSLGGV